MNTDDPILDQRVGRALMDGTSGSLAPVDEAVPRWIARSLGIDIPTGGRPPKKKLGTEKTTQEMHEQGVKARDQIDLSGLQDVAEETDAQATTAGGDVVVESDIPMEQVPGDEIPPGDMAPGATDEQIDSVLEPVDADIDPVKHAEEAQAREDLERRTRERNINLDYIEQPEEIGRMLDQNADLIEHPGTEALSEIEADVEGNVAEIMRPVLAGEVNGNLTSRQLLAGRQMLITMVADQQRLAKKIVSQAASDEDKANYVKTTEQAIMLQKFMQGQIREAGRTLNSLKVTAKVVNSADLQQMEQFFKDSPGSVSAMAQMQLDAMAEGASVGEMVNTMAKVSRLKQSTASIINYWMASILSGFRTQEVNIVSNLTMQMMNTLFVRPIAGAVGSFRRAVSGSEDGVYLTEVAAEYVAWRQGMRDALTMATRVWKEGTFNNQGEYVSTFGGHKVDVLTQDSQNLSEAIGVGRVPVVSHLLNLNQRATEAASYGMLTAGDEFFKAMAYRKSIYGQAVRIASQEGLTGQPHINRANDLMDNITKSMHEEAMSESERLTFTNEVGGWMGAGAKALTKIAAEYPAMRLIVPFIRTPTALLDRTMQMSPLAVLQADFRRRVAAGGAEADLAMAEMIFGTSMMGLFVMLYHEGAITGDGPENFAQREAWDAMGLQTNSVRVGNTWIAYNRGLDPMGISLGGIATLMDRVYYAGDEGEAADWAAGLIFAIASHFKDAAYLQGISEVLALIDGYKDPQKYLARQTGSMVPSLYRDIEAIRRTVSDEASWVEPPEDKSFWTQLNHQLEVRVPGNIGDSPPPARHWDGEPKVALNGETAYLFNQLWVTRYTNMKDDKASAALAVNGVKVQPPPPVIALEGKSGIKVDITQDLNDNGFLYDKLQVYVGKARRQRLDALVKTKGWADLDAGPGQTQAEYLEEHLSKGLKTGQKQFLGWLVSDEGRAFLDNPELGEMAVFLRSEGLLEMVKKGLSEDVKEGDEDLLRKAGMKGFRGRTELNVPQYIPKMPQ